MWAPCFRAHLTAEAFEAPQVRGPIEQLHYTLMSSYRERLKDPELIARYELKTERAVRDATAVARRRKSQLDIPFSTWARSISYFNQRVPTRVWVDNRKGFRIVHRDIALKMLDYMLVTEPKPPFAENPFVAIFGVDQCNFWQASSTSKKGEFRGAERLNSQGMPIAIRSQTVLNVVQRQVPITFPMLTPADVALITERGPYTQDFRLIFPVLHPRTVNADMWNWADELISLLVHDDEQLPDARPTQLRLPSDERTITERVLAKPPNKPPGPSEMKFHPSVPNCETQSFTDVQKMWAALLGYCSFAQCICIFIFCDGQLVELLRSCKINWPSDYKRILIGNGHFHAFAHLTFCLNEGWWMACTCTFAAWQKKKKQIKQHMPDLQHDNAKHCLDFLRVDTAAILCFLLLDVKSPPPWLLIQDLKQYISLVKNEGGIVSLQFVVHVGSPVLKMQRSIRGAQGAAITRCMAYAFHCHRSLANKTKSVYICMITLMGLTCAHPKLVPVLEQMSVVSLLGRIWVAFDRLIEYINLLQQKRGTAFRAFDSQLHFTKYLKPLVHVDAAWRDAEGGESPLDDGIPTYLYNDIA